MISILIPVYNYDCSALLKDLSRQAGSLKEELKGEFDYEIILADDASTETELRQRNMAAASSSGCIYFEQNKNTGQAYLRNTMVDMARFDYLLMIDADAEVCTDDFIRCYWEGRDKGDVICGTLRNPEGAAPKGCELRYRYEKQAEKLRSAALREKNPYNSFSAFNVMFRRDVFMNIRFDTRCTEYGHEDTLMGLMLREQAYTVVHTDNPLVHKGLDSNDSFLRKTETALHMLHRLGPPLQEHTGASRVAAKLEKWHLKGATKLLYGLFRDLLRKNLLGAHPSILLFQLYKLGYYCTLRD